MGWLLDELEQMAGPDAEAQVRQSARRARHRLEPMLRELTGLRLKTTDADVTGVTIRYEPGLPDVLAKVDLEPSERAAVLLASHLHDIRSLLRSIERLSRLIDRLRRVDISWAEQASSQRQDLDCAHAVGEVAIAERRAIFSVATHHSGRSGHFGRVWDFGTSKGRGNRLVLDCCWCYGART